MPGGPIRRAFRLSSIYARRTTDSRAVLSTVQLSVALDDVPIMWDPSCQANVIPAPPYGNSTRHQKDRENKTLVSPSRITACRVDLRCEPASMLLLWLELLVDYMM
jgi:hypothetical protein